ncbi:MAG: efflux RND transporter periplasmic adaptor subunit [Myxococcota bacterium]
MQQRIWRRVAKVWLCLFLGLMGGLFLGLMGCKEKSKVRVKTGKWQKLRKKRRASLPKPVHATRVRKGTIEANFATTTTLEAESNVMILSQVKGLVRRLRGIEGRRFRRGASLAMLSNPYLRIADEQAALDVEKAKLALRRHRRLLKKGYVSREQEEQLVFQLRQAEIRRKQTLQDLKNLRIVATISGVVVERKVNKGSWVLPNTQVFTMEDPRSLVAHMAIPEKYLGSLKSGLEATLRAEAFLGKVLRAKVIRVSPTVDAKTSTVRVTLGNLRPVKNLRSGMFVRARLRLKKHVNVPVVPKKALLYEQNRPTVFVVRGDASKCGLTQPLSRVKAGRGRAKGSAGGSRAGQGMRPKANAESNTVGKAGPKSATLSKRFSSFARARCRVERVWIQKGIENERVVEVRKGLVLGDAVVVLGQEELQNKANVRIVQWVKD